MENKLKLRCRIQISIISIFSFFYLIPIQGQVSWIGSFDSNWKNGQNWDAGVIPDENDDVLISNGTFDPIISDTVSILSMTFNEGNSQLSITESGVLNIDGISASSTAGITILQGYLQNDGEINIGLNSSTGSIYGIHLDNGGNIENNGIIRTGTAGSIAGAAFYNGYGFYNTGCLEIQANTAGVIGLISGYMDNYGFLNIVPSDTFAMRVIQFEICGNEGKIDLNGGTLELEQEAEFFSNPCDTIRNFDLIVRNDGIFFNRGYAYNVGELENYGQVSNIGILHSLDSLYASPNSIANSGVLVYPTTKNSSCGGILYPLDEQNSSDTDIEFYYDAAATLSAGSYNYSSGTFTPNFVIQDDSTYTLYVHFDSVFESCPFTLPWSITLNVENGPEYDLLEKFYSDFGGNNWTNNNGWLMDCDPCGMSSGVAWFGIQCNGEGGITQMILTDNNLTGSFEPDAPSNSDHLCDLSSIEVIDLSYNTISGPLPACIFNATRDVYLNNNQFSGNLPSTFSNVSTSANIDVSNNELSGCYENLLNPLCALPQMTNSYVSDGNDFDSDWEQYCTNGGGVCCTDTFNVDLGTILNGTYYAKQVIKLSGPSSASTDITLSSKKVITGQTNTVHSDGANLIIQSGGCRTKSAINFDGMNDLIQLSNFDISGNFTINFWFRTDKNYTDSDPRMFVMGPNSRFEIGIDRGTNGLWIYDGTIYTDSAPLNDNNWHHISAVNTGTVKTIYVDGELILTFDSNNSVYNGQIRVANWFGGLSSIFEGEIDDLRIYNTNLTVEEVLAEYNCADYRNDENLRLHYTFDDGIPFIDNSGVLMIEDESGNGNHGTIINMALMGLVSNFVDPFEEISDPCCNNPLIVNCQSYIASLVPFDVDGDSNPDTEQVIVLAESFDNNSSAGCGGNDFTVSFTPDGNTSEMTYNCDDIGQSMVTIYFIDGFGNIDSCSTLLDIVDTNDDTICP